MKMTIIVWLAVCLSGLLAGALLSIPFHRSEPFTAARME